MLGVRSSHQSSNVLLERCSLVRKGRLLSLSLHAVGRGLEDERNPVRGNGRGVVEGRKGWVNWEFEWSRWIGDGILGCEYRLCFVGLDHVVSEGMGRSWRLRLVK
jgi:hypothetical protein